jgi:NAD+ synthase
MEFHREVLDIDAEATAERIATYLRDQITGTLKKTGAVVGISGGIDSALVATLCTRALGADRVFGVALPGHESESVSAELARGLADHVGFTLAHQPISAALEGLGCYERRNEAIRRVFPEFQDDWTAKITNPGSILDKETFNFFRLTVESPEGTVLSRRIPAEAYLQIVAASNLKQRVRMTALYYHAERLNRAVIGTANRDELGQGFFVKYGDGGADLHPIVRLYKTQVFQLARHLGVPETILSRAPTTDTYSAEVSQVEFYYGLDFERMDLITWALEHSIPAAEVATVLHLETEQIERAFANIARKRVATNYLRSSPLELVGVGPVTPIDPVAAHPTASRR